MIVSSFLSSHLVSNIETIADEVAIMKHGKLTAKGFQSDTLDDASITNKPNQYIVFFSTLFATKSRTPGNI